MKFNGKWSSKAETLTILDKNQKKLGIHVPKNYYFTKKEYLKYKNKILFKIKKFFKNKKIILRSSSRSEDQKDFTNAGKYKSYLNLESKSKKVERKIELIINDFNNNKDQIIVQEYITKPEVAGVIFTRNINNNSPYYFVNLDQSGRTDLITSGKINPSMKTLVFYKNMRKYKINKKYKNLLKSVQKIENLFSNDRLDIEFCIKSKKVYVFQCRSLKKFKKTDDNKIENALINITKKIDKLKKKILS